MQDKIVVITGSTSGIGLGVAEHLASLGSKVVINGFAASDMIEQICLKLKNLGATDVFYHNADLSKPLEITAMFEQILEKFGKIDVLINNAGIQFVAPIEDFPPEKWEAILRIDLISAFYTIKYALPSMKKNGFGRIINIASAHALVASPFKSAYVAAKHGLLGLTKTVALECAEYGVTVNAICPGYCQTQLVLDQVANTAKVRGISEEEVIKKVMLEPHATKKFIKIAELAALVEFLCSSKSASVTGAALPMDGGWTAH